MNLFGNEARKKKKMPYDSEKRINTFSLIFFLILAILFMTIIIRLLFILVVESGELTIDALNQITKTEVINSNRGIIYDRNKKELAINISKANVFYNMGYLEQGKKESFEDFKKRREEIYLEDAKTIANICGLDEDEVYKNMKGTKVVRLASNIERSKAIKLKEKRSVYGRQKKKNLRAMSIDDVTRRYYPYNNLASHVIGFINDESMGQYGVEASFDEELTGIPGKNVVQKDNAHNIIPLTEGETFAPKEGYSLLLTIDANIQQFAESAAKKAFETNQADSCSIIVQDTKNGEILAMTTKSDYNLNDPKKPVTKEQEKNWSLYTDKEKTNIWYDNWRNFNVNDQYEPGSTFKVITAASAIEQNTTSPDATYVCGGEINLVGTVLKCTSHARGQKTMAEAFEQSCNVSFVKIGEQLGPENFLKYIKAFGFGERTGIELNGESLGLVPEKAEDINPVRFATMCYGHGIAVTPIQLINSVSCVANGGFLNRPRIVKEIIDDNNNIIEKKETKLMRRVISQSTSDTMRGLMERVVLNGTGKLAKVPGYRVGGKSGTAEIAREDGRGYEDAYIASFVGVAPINDPKITVLVIVKNPKGEILGGTVAAPVVSEVMERTLNYLKIQKTEEVKEEAKEYVTIPDVRGMLLEDGGKRIIDSGIKFDTNMETISDSAVIVGQNPSAGIDILKGQVIDLAIDNNDGDVLVMPDLSRKNKSEIENILKKLKVDYNIEGDGGFISQSPEKGKELDRTTKVKIILEDVTTDKNESSNNKANNKGDRDE